MRVFLFPFGILLLDEDLMIYQGSWIPAGKKVQTTASQDSPSIILGDLFSYTITINMRFGSWTRASMFFFAIPPRPGNKKPRSRGSSGVCARTTFMAIFGGKTWWKEKCRCVPWLFLPSYDADVAVCCCCCCCWGNIYNVSQDEFKGNIWCPWRRKSCCSFVCLFSWFGETWKNF